MKSKTEKIKEVLTKEVSASPIKSKELLSTGSTLLNLACSGRVCGGFPAGRYVFIVGDSASGKTVESLTCLAEATVSPYFKDYDLYYDNGEDGCLFDIEKFFGKKVAEKMQPPAVDSKGDPVFSTTVEEFYYHLDDVLDKGKPCIYILDSMDSLSSEDESLRFQENKESHYKGKKAAGSYGDGKAKKNSSGIRQILPKLRDTKSILIVISQTRDNIGFGAQYNPKTRSGGKALRFYAHLELWSSIKERIKKRISGKDRELGIVSLIQVKKNRLTGKLNSVEVPILHSSGLDDITSCVEYLIEEKHWKKDKSSGEIQATEFGLSGDVEQIVKDIETKNQEKELRYIVGSVWKDIEAKCDPNRKKRYE